MIITKDKLRQAAPWSMLLSAAVLVSFTAQKILLGLALVTPVILALTHRGRQWETRAKSGGSA